MFRIAAKNTSKDHPDSALFQVGGTYDDAAPAKGALSDVAKEYPKSDGYVLVVEELVRKSDDKASWEEVG